MRKQLVHIRGSIAKFLQVIASQAERSDLRRRPLRLEFLESRELLARDLTLDYLFAVQNIDNPFDVDGRDAAIPLDAMLIANYLNGATITEAALDVNGDSQVSIADFDMEIDYLNSARQSGAAGHFDSTAWQGDSGGLGAAPKNGGSKAKSYQYSVVGNADNALVTLPVESGGLALVGGGTDVDEVFRWLGAKASGGDFLVLRATGNNAYNSYIDHLVPSLDSVATLIISTNDGALDPFVAQTIRDAEAIFFAGGDQADYVGLWSNTPLESALYDALARNVPIGGTSAGLAILGDYDFAALNGTISSTEALSNPYDARITLDGGFVNERDYSAVQLGSTPLSLLNNTITDSHFQQRDRMGRLLTFVARLDADGTLLDTQSLGIGVNEQTSLLVEPTGIGRVVGNSYSKKLTESEQQRSVYFLDTNTVAPDPLSTPLSFSNMQIVRATYDPQTGHSDTFDLLHWTGVGVDSYSISAVSGGLVSTQTAGRIY